jgi:site-specific DNA-methyltransferase (adenine-specific)
MLSTFQTQEGDLIIDPFCGSGTTCIAAKKHNRRYIGVDISEEYCNIARQALIHLSTA